MLNSLKQKALAKLITFAQRYIPKPLPPEEVVYVSINIDRTRGEVSIMTPHRITGTTNVISHVISQVTARVNVDTNDLLNELVTICKCCKTGSHVFKFKDGVKRLKLVVNLNGYYLY